MLNLLLDYLHGVWGTRRHDTHYSRIPSWIYSQCCFNCFRYCVFLFLFMYIVFCAFVLPIVHKLFYLYPSQTVGCFFVLFFDMLRFLSMHKPFPVPGAVCLSVHKLSVVFLMHTCLMFCGVVLLIHTQTVSCFLLGLRQLCFIFECFVFISFYRLIICCCQLLWFF